MVFITMFLFMLRIKLMLIQNWATSSIKNFINKAPKTMPFTKPINYQKKLHALFKSRPYVILFKNFIIFAIEVYNSVSKYN